MPKSKSQSQSKPQTKTQFVLAQDSSLPVAEIVKRAKAAGITMKAQLVHNVRWAAKQKGKNLKKPVVAAATQPKHAATAVTRQVAAHATPVAHRTTPKAVSDINALDLAYAVGRLVAAGKTTTAEVASLASERVARITTLESELAALKHGAVPAEIRGRVVKVAKLLSKSAARPTSEKASAPTAKKSSGGASSAARKFTMTPKALAARKIQAQYMGALRQVPDAEKAKYKALTQEKGVAFALAELKKRVTKR